MSPRGRGFGDFLFGGSLRGEAPHKLQVGGRVGGGGRSPPPPNAPKAPEGVQSSQGEVVGDRLPGSPQGKASGDRKIDITNSKMYQQTQFWGLNWVPMAPFGALFGQK